VNWISNYVRPKIQTLFTKRETPDNLWVQCPQTGEMVFHRDLEANHYVVPGSNVHMRIGAKDRLAMFFDPSKREGESAIKGAYDLIPTPKVATDPLKFKDNKRYIDRLKDARHKTGFDDSVLVALGKLKEQTVCAAVQDFAFMGGSLGMAAGEAIVKGAETALSHKCPYVVFIASGGARMQEGILSLMQMPRTTVALNRLKDACLPYIVVLTNPTTGGVTASYAMLGDVHIAEPGALIGFAGPRVIEQTIREKLPEGFQTSEYLLDHGMVDMVVHRHDLRETIATLVSILMSNKAEKTIDTQSKQTNLS
jgi:acetyl-CoA carboxylase carboxyl transferase subunit beta